MSASDTPSRQDAVELLTVDHAAVEQMFRQIETLPAGDPRDRLVEGVARELSVHAAIEEQILYPAMRDAFPDGDTLVQEAIDQHQRVKDTLAAIERADAPAARDPLVDQLMGDVRHHVDEEESELFPKLKASFGSDELRDMGADLAAARKMAPTLVDKARDALGRN